MSHETDELIADVIFLIIKVVVIFALLSAAAFVGPNEYVLYGAVTILVVFGIPEVLQIIRCVIHEGLGYRTDPYTVLTAGAVGYIVINYLV